jgi:DNA-binding transcriptional ArsR family regulator
MTDPGTACCPELAECLEARLFKALCDPTRIAIVVRLAEACDARTVSQIAAQSPVDTSVVSRHLAALREAGIVAAERRGKEVHYRVRHQALAETLRTMAAALENCCPPQR